MEFVVGSSNEEDEINDDNFQATQPTQEVYTGMMQDTEQFLPSKYAMSSDDKSDILESLFCSESSEHSLAGGNKETIYRGSSAVYGQSTSRDMATALDTDRPTKAVAHAKTSRDAAVFATFRAAKFQAPLKVMTPGFDSSPVTVGKPLSEIDTSSKRVLLHTDSSQYPAKPTPFAVARLSPSEIPPPKHVSKLYFVADRERIDVCMAPSDLYNCLFDVFTKNNVYASFSPDQWSFLCVAYPGGRKVEFCVQALQRRKEDFGDEDWIRECTVVEFYKRKGCSHTYSMLMQTIRFTLGQTLTVKNTGSTTDARNYGAPRGAQDMPPLTLPADIPAFVPNPEELRQSLNILVAADMPASAKISILSFVQELVCDGVCLEVLDSIGIGSVLNSILDISKDSEVLRLTLGIAENLCRRESFARSTLQSPLFQKIMGMTTVSLATELDIFELQRIALCVVQSIAKHETLRGALRNQASVESLKSSQNQPRPFCRG